ncbi:hypothetical protein JIN85_18725 [Luteolibacter pohnpeiensis]|uniref:Uncharacterized protein n=1 Tax=Luteolibacter pohnpeiensis TaxID=454153 RepID=A0A934S9T1_9BACT|nr:hypothetical protein [Luteolibacter pohnpeiensis]
MEDLVDQVTHLLLEFALPVLACFLTAVLFLGGFYFTTDAFSALYDLIN